MLQGGADIAPETYGETPMNPAWSGDRIRDRYEIELFHEFVRQGKPVFGICRGCQMINVALGGTLYQDLATQLPSPATTATRRSTRTTSTTCACCPTRGSRGIYPDGHARRASTRSTTRR